MLLAAPAMLASAMLASGIGTAVSGEIRREEIVSPALGGKLTYAIYLPDGYEGSRARYPVIYLLHGAGGDAGEWLDSSVKLEKLADGLIRSGAMPAALFVMPECRGCWWIDSPRAHMETAFIADLLPAVAARWRTIEGRGGRAIAGFSAGGFGAVRFALKYPDTFAAVAAFSPAVYSDVPPAQSLARSQQPFKTQSGVFDNAFWKARNYPALLDGYRQQDKRVPMYLVSGDHDKLGIAFETALLFKTMYELQGDSVELRVVDGGHSCEVAGKAMPDALAFLSRHLQKPATVTAGAGAAVLPATVR